MAEPRKLTEASVDHQSSRIVACNNDVSAAHMVSAAQKAAKVAYRTAGEGPVGASVLGRGTGHGDGSEHVLFN